MPDRKHNLMRLLTFSGRGESGWQVIYTGFVLIMLCFFIMLTSFAAPQESRITRFARAFSSAVSVLPQGKGIESGPVVSDSDPTAVDKSDITDRLFEEISQLGRQNELSQAEMRIDPRGVVMTLSDTLLFASGEARIAPDAHRLLDKVGRVIARTRAAVEIGGHTDNRPIQTRAFPSNWELSTSRAVNVLRYLVEHQYVDSGRVSAIGFGEYNPVAANDAPVDRARNRRVEFVFKAEQGR